MNRGHCFYWKLLGASASGVIVGSWGTGGGKEGFIWLCHSYFFVLLEGGEGVELAGLSHEKEKGTL